MDRRSFIKTIAAATTAPLALLQAKPAIKPITDGGFQSVPFDRVQISFPAPCENQKPQSITLEAGEVYKSKIYDLAKQKPSRFRNHDALIVQIGYHPACLEK